MERVLLKEIADVKLCIVSSSKKKECDEAVKWITLSSLLPFNGTGELLLSSEYYPDEDIKVKKHDIIMKRVAPTGVNYIEDDIDAYVYNNLFIIRTKEKVKPDYLAAYLDENIENFVNGLTRGSVAPSIGRKDLMEMETGFLQYTMKLLEEKYAEELRLLNIQLPNVESIPQVRFDEAKQINVVYYTSNTAKTAEGTEKKALENEDDTSLIPDVYAEPILVYGTCMRLKSNPQHVKFSYWLSMYNSALANMRSKISVDANYAPSVKLKRY